MVYAHLSGLELLAPAGGWPQLRAALKAGANAVFFGVEDFNMRAGAKNFSLEELCEIVKTAHEQRAKAYLTLNIIIYEDELTALENLLDHVAQAGVDAIIAWDFAVIEKARERGIPVHISTQMSISNSASLAYFVDQGIRRFVLARECTLEAIVAMRASLEKRYGEMAQEIEIEAFAHGAMCVSISGRCFMSGSCCGKSANRGECTQPCRREYHIVDKRGDVAFDVSDGHVMSPKDLCALPFLEKLIEAGIMSFKIEGRNRSADYVYETVGAYRRVLDYYLENQAQEGFEEGFAKVKEAAMASVRTVYNRDFSEGFYFGKPMEDWTTPSGNQATTRRVYVGKVTHYFSKASVAEVKIEAEGLTLGDAIFFEGDTTGCLPQTLDSMQIDHQAVDRAPKGCAIGLKTVDTVRLNDKVYKVVESV